MNFVMDSMAWDYAFVVSQIREFGTRETSRSHNHREVLDVSIRLDNPYRNLATGVGRQLNTKIAWLEAMQLIAGESYPELMVRHAPQFDQFRDGEVFHGSYGPRIRNQMPSVIRRLQEDGGTRQAVITIWDPAYDQANRRDLPCTVSLQFMVRNEALVMLTHMRSNDVWLGLPYDIFQFTTLQKTLAWCLGLPAGPYYHHAWSMHLYESDVQASHGLYAREPESKDVVPGILTRRGGGIAAWNDSVDIANRVLRGDRMLLDPHCAEARALTSIHGITG